MLTNALIAVGITSVIGYALMTHVQNRGRQRAHAGAVDSSGDSYSGTNDGFSLGSWFSGDASGSSTERGICSSSESSGGGDCGGGGDGGD